MLTAEEILTVPGVLDADLPDGVRAGLPERTPPAPWRSNVETTVWGFRSTPASASAVPAGLVPSLPIGAAAFVNYLDGAVGPYHEVLATPRCVRAGGLSGYVPFIAVDSLPSIHGGRTNWALPKVFAHFSGEPAAEGRLSGVGVDWSIGADVRQRGPWFPILVGASCAQPWPDGSTRLFWSVFRGRARIASVDVEVSGPESLTSVLPAGRHPGLVIRGSVRVGAPRAGSSPGSASPRRAKETGR